MDLYPSSTSGPRDPAEAAPVADSRVGSTPNYGTLGPGSDVATSEPAVTSGSSARSGNSRLFGPILAMAVGVLLAVMVASVGNAHAAWAHFANLFSARGNAPERPELVSAKDSVQLDRLKPQKQAEALLELAVDNSDGAVAQISSRVDRWQGKVKWNSQIATLTTAALNSSDMRVRESGIEVELAAYGLAKDSASLGYVMKTAESRDPAQKIWALWALGLLGNRGVKTEQVVQVLSAHLKDADQDSRRWAVEGLALTGTTQTIEPLLTTLHDDPSPAVRERAACSLAESGMFTREQRFSAVPRLLTYMEDPGLDAQTHTWAYQALSDITRERLPNDPAAWRNWYESAKNN